MEEVVVELAQQEYTTASRSIDAFSFTIQAADDCLAAVKALIGLELEERNFGSRMYRRSAASSDGAIVVCWDGAQAGMGAHVYALGQGCRILEARAGFPGWQEWFREVIGQRGIFTRVDLALDAVGAVPFETVERQIAERLCITRSQPGNSITGRCKGREDSRSVYLGSRQSMTMLRCYEKGKQLGENPEWLRFEFEFKGEKAAALARVLAFDGWDKAVGMVRTVVEFVDETKEASRRCRRVAAQWWVQLVAASKHAVSVSKTVARSLERMQAWICKQAAVTIGVLVEAHGGDISWLGDLANESVPRRRAHHRMALLAT